MQIALSMDVKSQNLFGMIISNVGVGATAVQLHDFCGGASFLSGAQTPGQYKPEDVLGEKWVSLCIGRLQNIKAFQGDKGVEFTELCRSWRMQP